jgi:hypothetical protein
MTVATQTAALNGDGKAAGTVVFVGHARLPHSLATRDGAAVVTVELEADASSGEIVCVGAQAVPELGTKLVTTLLVGRNINESATDLAEEIRRRYICPSQKALSTAVLNAFEAYQRYRQAGLEA